MVERQGIKKKGVVMVFGVFDGLHKGHESFLRQARRWGSELIAVVARDAAVRELKKKRPRLSEKERARALGASRMADRVVLGDKEQGIYLVAKRYKPAIICIGYDQDALAEDLRRRMRKGYLPAMRLIRLRPHRPYMFRSSLLYGIKNSTIRPRD